MYPFPDLSNLNELFLVGIRMDFKGQARIVAANANIWKSCGGEYMPDWLRRTFRWHNCFGMAVYSKRFSKLEALRIDVGRGMLLQLLRSVNCTLFQEQPCLAQDGFSQLREIYFKDSEDECRRWTLLLLTTCRQLRTVSVPLLRASDT